MQIAEEELTQLNIDAKECLTTHGFSLYLKLLDLLEREVELRREYEEKIKKLEKKISDLRWQVSPEK